jgi:hypothetical protein
MKPSINIFIGYSKAVMKTFLKLFPLVFLMLISSQSMAQHSIRIVEINGESFGNLKINYAGNDIGVGHYGFGANVTVGKERFGAILEYDYRKIDLKNLAVTDVKSVSTSEFYLGARYYPMRPTFIAGQVAVRLTAGAEYGFDMEPNWRTLLFSGLAFSPVTSCSGASVNFVYRPGKYAAGGYLTEPSYTIRLSIIIGPSLK